jgi:hypothetical protein
MPKVKSIFRPKNSRDTYGGIGKARLRLMVMSGKP